MRGRKAGSNKKPAVAAETSESIATQTEAFLKAGGVVEIIKRGVSGQTSYSAKPKAAK